MSRERKTCSSWAIQILLQISVLVWRNLLGRNFNFTGEPNLIAERIILMKCIWKVLGRYGKEVFQVSKVTFSPCICTRFTHTCFSVLISSNVLLGNYLKYTAYSYTTSDTFQVHTFRYEATEQGGGDVPGAIKKISSCDFVGFMQ